MRNGQFEFLLKLFQLFSAQIAYFSIHDSLLDNILTLSLEDPECGIWSEGGELE